MYVCVKCRRQMVCSKNSVGADFGRGYIYAADMYACPECGSTILATNARSFEDPEYRSQESYLRMKKGTDDELDLNACPICGEIVEMRSDSGRHDSICKNGHRWHTCLAHGTEVMRESDSEDKRNCTCVTRKPD